MGAMAIIFKCILSLCMILHFVDGKTVYFVKSLSFFFSKNFDVVLFKKNKTKNEIKTCDDMTVYIFPAECQ